MRIELWQNSSRSEWLPMLIVGPQGGQKSWDPTHLFSAEKLQIAKLTSEEWEEGSKILDLFEDCVDRI